MKKIYILFSLIFLLSVINLWDEIMIIMYGKETVARVVRVESFEKTKKIVYTYNLQGKVLTDSVLSDKSHVIGDEFVIKYLPRDPRTRSIRW